MGAAGDPTREIQAVGGQLPSTKWFIRNNTDLPAHNLPNPSPALAQNVTDLAAIATCEAACLKIGAGCKGFVFVTTALEAKPRCAFKSSDGIQPISRAGTIAVTMSAPPQPAPPPPAPSPPPPVATPVNVRCLSSLAFSLPLCASLAFSLSLCVAMYSAEQVPGEMLNPDGHGAISVSGAVPANEMLSLTIVMSWRYSAHLSAV